MLGSIAAVSDGDTLATEDFGPHAAGRTNAWDGVADPLRT
jgi:hypothetical protein